MQINSTDIPANQIAPGGYVYDWHPPAIVGYNGLKEPIISGGSSLTLTILFMDDTDWDWWVSTLLGGEASATFTQCQLYDNNRDLTTFGHCIVYAPQQEAYYRGLRKNVKIEIVDIY